jgi:hypothetical protein
LNAVDCANAAEAHINMQINNKPSLPIMMFALRGLGNAIDTPDAPAAF